VAVSRYRWRLVLIAWFFNWSNHDEKQRTSDALLSSDDYGSSVERAAKLHPFMTGRN
jgi:hypothetical protein